LRTVKVGVIGCGFISKIYLSNMTGVFRDTEVVAVTDIVLPNARGRAEEFGIPRVCATVEELLRLDDIEIVVNLTIPKVHAAINRQILEAGKHCWTEKPLATNPTEAKELVELAGQKGLYLGSAPDTFLGAAVQTARRLIDQGWIGKPIGAIGHHLRPGPESWHPDPDFLYQKGGGPLLDSAPYYITNLVYLMGPVERVACGAVITFPERTITSQPRYGQKIKVEVPTLVSAILNFRGGAMATLVFSVDVEASRWQDSRQNKQSIEIYGSEGVISIPSPGQFGGQVYCKRNGIADWIEVPALFGYATDSRGVGPADMASAIIHGRQPRASVELALHVHEVLFGLEAAADSGTSLAIDSTFVMTPPMNGSALPGDVDVA
jgi:predicted dehydrogenase